MHVYRVEHRDHSTLADQDLRTCNKVKARVCPQNTRYLNVDVDGCLVASLRTIWVIGPEMKFTSLTFICTIPYKVFPNIFVKHVYDSTNIKVIYRLIQ